MPEFGRVKSHSQTPVDRLLDPVRQKARAIGQVFNRKVFPHKAQKKLIQQQQVSQRSTPQRPPTPVHKRRIQSVSVQRHIQSPEMLAKSPRQTIAPHRHKASGAGAALYDNQRYRSFVARERVTEQFEQPQRVSKNIMDAAWSFYHQGNACPWGKNQALLSKAGHLGQVSISINLHDQILNQPLAKYADAIEAHGRQVIDNLQEGVNQVDHVLRSQGHIMSPAEYQYLTGINRALQAEQKLMLQVMEDPGAVAVAGSLDLRQAMELKRLGYDLTPAMAQHFSPLNDRQLKQGSGVNFGSGAIHSVTRLRYETPTGVVDKIFKGEDPVDPCPFDSITGPENYLDKNKPRFAARNFAAARFDRMLGTSLMPRMELAVHEGQLGVLMDVAKGVKPWEQHFNTYNWIPVEDQRQPQVAASIQQQLNSAEWLDGICAQQDRHAGNLFVDPKSGKVTLIDNDMGFYPGQHHVRSASRNPGFRRFSGSTAGLPAVIDARVYQQLMSITPSQIQQQMNGLLTRQEIQATVDRVAELQHHARQLADTGRVIKNWQQWHDPATGLNAAQFQRRYAPDSYLLSVQGQSRGL